jgi:hypothetical protein
MTTATPAAPKSAVPEKNPTKPGETGKLPLKGGKEGVTRSLDNKEVIKSPPDPKVVKAAESLAGVLDRRAKIDKEAQDAGQALLKAFDESKKAKKVRIVGEVKTYWFSKATLSKLVIEKKDANEA